MKRVVFYSFNVLHEETLSLYKRMKTEKIPGKRAILGSKDVCKNFAKLYKNDILLVVNNPFSAPENKLISLLQTSSQVGNIVIFFNEPKDSILKDLTHISGDILGLKKYL